MPEVVLFKAERPMSSNYVFVVRLSFIPTRRQLQLPTAGQNLGGGKTAKIR
jgi:hypothetical protein